MAMARSMFTKHASQGGTGSGSADISSVPEINVDGPDEESSDIMNVLFLGDDQGCFKMRMFGELETGSASLLTLLRSYGLTEFEVQAKATTDPHIKLLTWHMIQC